MYENQTNKTIALNQDLIINTNSNSVINNKSLNDECNSEQLLIETNNINSLNNLSNNNQIDQKNIISFIFIYFFL